MPHLSATEIRPAGAQDATAIRELTRAAYARWVPVIGREPLPMTADYERALREHAFDLLFADGRMVALIETRLEPDHLWIENVAVSPDHQGKGYGRRLLALAERKAAQAGRGTVRLLTNGAFAANIALYARLRYVISKREPFMGGVAVHMSKTVGP